MIYETKSHNCPVCNTHLENAKIIWDKEASQIKYVGMDLLDQNDLRIHTKIVICPICGLVQTKNPMTKESLANFYNKGQYRTLFPAAKEDIINHIKGYYEYIKVVAEHLPFLDTLMKIALAREKIVGLDKDFKLAENSNFCALDIGSGADFVREMFQALYLGAETYIHDPGLPESNFNLTYEEVKNKQFDVITILNTLEHMYNPVEYLKNIALALKPNGCIVIVVPDLFNASTFLRLNGWFSTAHLYHFDVDSLLNVIFQAGLIPINTMNVFECNMSKVYMCCHLADKFFNKPFDASQNKLKIDYIKSTNNIQKMRNTFHKYNIRDGIKDDDRSLCIEPQQE